LAINNVDDSTSHEEKSRLSMQTETTALRGNAKVQKEQATKQDEIAQKLDVMMAQLASIAAELKSMPEKESSRYPKPPSSKFALSDY
jgi:hypothetical protein